MVPGPDLWSCTLKTTGFWRNSNKHEALGRDKRVTARAAEIPAALVPVSSHLGSVGCFSEPTGLGWPVSILVRSPGRASCPAASCVPG